MVALVVIAGTVGLICAGLFTIVAAKPSFFFADTTASRVVTFSAISGHVLVL
jgi:hypothetical protein